MLRFTMPLLLLAACSAMALCFLVPIAAILFGTGLVPWMGIACWLLMSLVVVVFNRTVWRACYRLAEQRFSLER